MAKQWPVLEEGWNWTNEVSALLGDPAQAYASNVGRDGTAWFWCWEVEGGTFTVSVRCDDDDDWYVDMGDPDGDLDLLASVDSWSARTPPINEEMLLLLASVRWRTLSAREQPEDDDDDDDDEEEESRASDDDLRKLLSRD